MLASADRKISEDYHFLQGFQFPGSEHETSRGNLQPHQQSQDFVDEASNDIRGGIT